MNESIQKFIEFFVLDFNRIPVYVCVSEPTSD